MQPKFPKPCLSLVPVSGFDLIWVLHEPYQAHQLSHTCTWIRICWLVSSGTTSSPKLAITEITMWVPSRSCRNTLVIGVQRFDFPVSILHRFLPYFAWGISQNLWVSSRKTLYQTTDFPALPAGNSLDRLSVRTWISIDTICMLQTLLCHLTLLIT